MKSTLALFLCLAGLVSSLAADPDQILLKSGEKISGVIIDAKETPEKITVNLSLVRGISDLKDILKNEIASITRATGENEAARKLKLPDRSTDAAWYQQAIEKQLKPWLARYTQSPLTPEMQAQLKSFQDELERVQAGNIRIGTRWYTPAEFEIERPEIEAADLLDKVKAAADKTDYSILADLLNTSLDKYSKTKAFPEIAASGKAALEKVDEAQLNLALTKNLALHQANFNATVVAVQRIVNQPVAYQASTPGTDIWISDGGWYHEGATKPDFNTADITKTQELIYKGKKYVTSDLNPKIVYSGDDLEFNSMTKYFITDRSQPRKRLTLEEMQEINRLYRILGYEEKCIASIQAQITGIPGFLADLKNLRTRLPDAPAKK